MEKENFIVVEIPEWLHFYMRGEDGFKVDDPKPPLKRGQQVVLEEVKNKFYMVSYETSGEFGVLPLEPKNLISLNKLKKEKAINFIKIKNFFNAMQVNLPISLNSTNEEVLDLKDKMESLLKNPESPYSRSLVEDIVFYLKRHLTILSYE